MTADQFQAKLPEYWSKIEPGLAKDMADKTIGLLPEDRDKLFNHLREECEYAPTFAKMCKIMDKHHIRARRAATTDWAYKCTQCGQLYAGRIDWVDAYACPKCFSRERSVVANPEKSDVVTFQSPCLMGWEGQPSYQQGVDAIAHCPTWANERRSYGPMCERYGRGGAEECRECACRTCCIREKRNKEIKRETPT